MRQLIMCVFLQALLQRGFRRRSLWLLKVTAPPSSRHIHCLTFLHQQFEIVSEQLVACLLSSAGADELRRLLEMNVSRVMGLGLILRIEIAGVCGVVSQCVMRTAGSSGSGSFEDQGPRAGCWGVQVKFDVECAAAASADAVGGCDYRTLTVICGTIGDGDGARYWGQRAREEMDLCCRDIVLPHSDV